MSATKVHQSIQKFAETAPSDTRNCIGIKVGQWARQGDVAVSRITKRPDAWDVLVTEHTQVALGSTIGSRHIATGEVRVYWPKAKDAAVKGCPLKLFKGDEQAMSACLGPVVEADQPWTLEHPEHAHHQFPAGTYLVTYQYDFNTKREVRD